MFDKLLQALVKLGYIRRRGRQRTDSSRVVGLVAKLSRLELVCESLRLALQAIEKQQPGWLEEVAPEAFLNEYLTKRSDYKLSSQQIKRLLHQTGVDGFWLLKQLSKVELSLLDEVQCMVSIWEQQFEQDEEGQYLGARSKIKASGLIQSPHEPEVRYYEKRGKGWQGYRAQVTETAEDKGAANFITDAGLATEVQSNDVESLPDIQARLEKRAQSPAQQYVDYAYVSGQQIAHSAQRGIELIGPIAPDPGPPGFQVANFQIDVAQRQATCPGGKTAVGWSVNHAADDTVTHVIAFGTQCSACPLRSQCTTAKTGRRVSYQQYQPEINQRRQEMKTEGFRQAMKQRAPIEGAISQLMRQGMRRARYRGHSRVNLQLILTATATNLRRLVAAWARGYSPSWAQATA